uniref:Uncharacterized protein n=1 Tax=Arion vulgaris TaxID=1028688 RepID=A0A0B7B825_9EUPU
MPPAKSTAQNTNSIALATILFDLHEKMHSHTKFNLNLNSQPLESKANYFTSPQRP